MFNSIRFNPYQQQTATKLSFGWGKSRESKQAADERATNIAESTEIHVSRLGKLLGMSEADERQKVYDKEVDRYDKLPKEERKAREQEIRDRESGRVSHHR